MMRVRIPGGQLTADQLRAVAGVAKEYGRDLADITDRQNVQFHWIRIEDIPAIWARLEEVGPVQPAGLRRRPAEHPGLPGGRPGRGRGAGRQRRAAGDRGGRDQQP